MKKIFTKKKTRLSPLIFFALLISGISNAQFVERWSNIISSPGSFSTVKNAVLTTVDGNVLASGTNKIVKYSSAGKIIWATDVPVDSRGLAMAQDQAGNIYVAAVNFINVLTVEGDFFIAKYNSDGQQLWSRVYDGPSHLEDVAAGLGIDQFGNVYVAGTTLEGSGVFNARERIHTVKFNSDGVLQWAKTFSTGSLSEASAVAVDFFTGDVYVAGRTSIPKDGDEQHLDDFTTVKYNTNGEEQWVSLYNGSLHEDDGATAITVDLDGNVLVTGFSTEKINSDFFAGTTVINTFKYDRATGGEIWHKRFGRDQPDSDGGSFFEGRASAIAADADGDVIVIGSTFSARWHTIKYRKSDGKVVWTKNFDNPDFADDDNVTGRDVPSAIAFDQQKNVYVTGFSLFRETNNRVRNDDIVTIKYRSSDGNELGSAHFDNGNNEFGSDIAVDTRGNAYVTGGGGTNFMTVSYGRCAIICPENITVNNEPGKCSANVNFEATTTGNCGPLVFLEGQDTVKSGAAFSVGQHNIVVISPSTDEICNFTITVVDNEKPVITQCAADLTVSCAANVPSPDISLVKATDNCGSVTISHVGDVISNQTCANRFTLTRTYLATDSHGNTATCSQVITVNDIVPPQINNFSLSKESLFPPNHTMQDITLSYDVVDNCVGNPPVKITITSNEPVNGVGDGDTDPDWIVIDAHHIQLRAERSALGNGRIYTITVTADDGCNPAVSVVKQVIVAHNITAPNSGNPFKIGSTVNFAGVFWDKPGTTHTSKWLLDSSTAVTGNIAEPSGIQNGKAAGSYKFTTAGVYKLQMNIVDQKGNTSYANTNGDLDAMVVIYDPNGGNVYGGGWFNSPAGALSGNPAATGKASYGFTVNYKNIVKPRGETQFGFRNGSFEFNAVNFDYLVINGAMAQFKGTGKITGGQSGIGFILTVIDGALDGTGVDKIRMKIFNRNTGAVIYDNQPGASDAALPATAVGANSVVVIQDNAVSSSPVVSSQGPLQEEKTADGLKINAYPNPAKNFFTLSVSSNASEKIMMQVFDQHGRSIETRQNIIPGSVVRLGDNYRAGTYFVRIIQGEEHKEIKLIKIAD
jgi:hypothetical protein